MSAHGSYCSDCGFENHASAQHCQNCGRTFNVSDSNSIGEVDDEKGVSTILKAVCPSCYTLLSENQKYCGHCGNSTDPVGSHSKITRSTREEHKKQSHEYASSKSGACPNCNTNMTIQGSPLGTNLIILGLISSGLLLIFHKLFSIVGLILTIIGFRLQAHPLKYRFICPKCKYSRHM